MSDETTATLSPLKRAFLAVQSLQGRVDELETARSEPIAIIGMSCRFPQAENLEQYWDLLARGGDAITVHPNRWPKEMLDDDDTVGERGSRWGGFLSSIDAFDPGFFSIAPREASYMDPQQRIFLEVCWEALENAGIAPDALGKHATGVFAGAATNDWPILQLRGGDLTSIGGHFASGIAHSIITGRISYLLGLSGPSISVDTACSSSLVAVHLACQALRAGDCEMALAGGTNALLLPDIGVAYARAGMAAQDGRCKVFDATADGFVRGEGSGVVVLKRLSKALADGDHIHALVRGSALNQDGASSSMTAPSGPAQEQVIRTALRAAGVQPADVSYVEAHGTGTVLGDPIEVQAIGAALGVGRAPGSGVLVGSVKSNFGHLEASAGIAGLIKIVLAMQHRAIPASLHCDEPNPLIPWDQLPVRVSTSLTVWDASEGGRIAGISGFGFSGTNAHVILAEAPVPIARPAPEFERPANILTLSAPTATGLRALALRLADHVAAHPELAVGDIAHTMNVGRARFRHRAAFVLDTHDSLDARLRTFAAGEEHPQTVSAEVKGSDAPRVMFLFSGQGSQYAGMARELYRTQPVFRRAIDECDALLQGTLEPGVLQILFPTDGNSALLDETLYTQPVLFSVEYALAQMWLAWGVKPTALMGHSLGEFVAAVLAGVFSLQDGLRLVAVRGQLGQRLTSVGSMAAVLTDVATVRAVLAAQGDRVTIAALNAPESNVISGPTDAMEAALAEFSARGIEVRRLPISNAFHSPAIEPMLAEFEAAASAINFGIQRIPVYSNLYGRRAAPGEMSNAQYWARHLREEVRFAEGFAAAIADGYSNFLEVGPHTILVGLGRQSFPNSDGLWLPTLRRGYDDWQMALGSLAQLYAHGVRIDWNGFDRDYARTRVVLPTYPFERQRFWVPAPRTTRVRRAGANSESHPLLARRINSPFVQDTIFETELSLETTPWLADHRVLGAAVLPATAHLEAAWSAAVRLHGNRVFALQDVDIHDALVTPEDGARMMQLALAPADGVRATFRVMSAASDDAAAEWRAHASGSVSLEETRSAAMFGDIAAIRARCTTSIAAEQLYAAVAQRGIVLGERFRGVVELYQGQGEALGKLRAPSEVAAELGRFAVHPALLDAALHVVTAALFDAENLATPGETYMPIALEQFRVLARPSGSLWSHAVARPRKANESPVVDVRVYDDSGAPVVEVVGLQFRRVETAAWAGSPASALDDQLYHIEWRSVDAPAALEPAAEVWAASSPDVVAAALSGTLNETVTQHRLDVYVAR
ncbi:MAG TPA: type I polyketide synthase, partial [Casimicrobiaceae bacterium]